LDKEKNHTIVHSEYNAKIIQVYAQKGETCTWDHYLFATALPQMLTARLSNKKRFLELAAYYILDQSKEFAKTEQRSLHEYFAPTTPQQKAYRTSQNQDERPKALQHNQKFLQGHYAHIVPKTTCTTIYQRQNKLFYILPYEGSE
jgi:hypothetical protein